MSSFNKKWAYDFFINIVVAFSIGLTTSFIYALFKDFKLEILILCILNLLLASLLLITLNEIRSLSIKSKGFTCADKKDTKTNIVEEALYAIRISGYIKSHSKEERIKEILTAGSYIRGQNIYYMMHNGILRVRRSLFFINDHPFKPFADLINSNIPEGTIYRGVGAFPDELYSKEDILHRINIIENKKTEYYFLPSQEVNISMVIFDEEAALIYAKPVSRAVCNFSEGLLITDKNSLKEIVKVFYYIYESARKRSRGDLSDVVKELKNLSAFYTGSPQSETSN